MTTWNTVIDGLQTLLQSLAGVDEPVTPVRDLVVNQADQAPVYPPQDAGISVTLELQQIRAYGRDEHLNDWDVGTQMIKRRGKGTREVDVDIVVQSVQADEPWPWATAENIRSRIWLESAQEILATLGLGLSTVGPIVRQDAEYDGRIIPAARLSCTFNATVVYSDTDVTTIETVNVSGQVRY